MGYSRHISGLLTGVALFWVTGSFATPAPYGNWLIYFGQASLSERFSLWTEAQYRNYNALGDLEQLLLRTALQYDLPNGVTVSQGYAFVADHQYTPKGEIYRHEHRPYQQVLVRNRFGRLYVNHRYRFETRIWEEDLRFRVRYFLQGHLALNKPQLERGALYLSAYDEIFLHTDSQVFDRNRFYLGLGYVLNPDLRLELANMVQTKEVLSRHQFQVTMLHRFRLPGDRDRS